MTAAQAAVVNEALSAIGSQVQITDLNDGSVAGNDAGLIYLPLTQMLLRQLGPDFARKRAPLVIATTPATPPYLFEYLYPADCLRPRQIAPAPGGDQNDPQPIRGAIENDVINSAVTKVILTNQPNAALVYTGSNVTEALWDATFRQVVVKWLAAYFSMPIAGRPDFAKALLEEAAQMAQMAESFDDGV